MGKTDKIVHYVSACRHEGIKILPPDINESGKDFTATKEGIRFGFAGIRGVGAGVGEAIMLERQKGGPFANIHDFVDRVDASQAKRNVVEALIKAGAFDSTGYTRMQMMSFVDKNNPQNIIDAATKRQKDKAVGQFSMFDMFAEVEGSGFSDSVPEPDSVEWDRRFKLTKEYEVLGIYVSDHPLRPYEYALAKSRDYALAEIEENVEVQLPNGAMSQQFKVPEGKPIRFAGMVTNVMKRTTKNGDPMAIVTLEDMEGSVTIVMFPKLYKKAARLLAGDVDPETGESQSDIFISVLGKLERSDRGDQVIAQEVNPIELNSANNTPNTLVIHMPASQLQRQAIETLGQIFSRYPGMDCIEIRVETDMGDVMRMEIPTRIDGRSMVLLTELKDFIGQSGYAQIV